ncbi:hypothetical protein [Arsenicibacter rosenii]|uniref:Uncharacterized protein n=1 Tax=Arsenicibacter rosenii TaxID=1750698 RepID=A0A1S2VFW5_9BACT|nr:hypothetical protein [Arsenicibacter rosenii]OIN57623.1 hypothetical protein BLX24_19290 [Arsenicibacter rosenii]
MSFKSLTRAVVDFTKANYRRFLADLLIAGLAAGVTGLWGAFSENRELKTCQDERTALLRENTRAQSVQDSIHYAGIIARKNDTISRKDEQIRNFHLRAARDSIYQQSLLRSIQELNRYAKTGQLSGLRK